MRRFLLFILASCLFLPWSGYAADTVSVREVFVPVLLEREDNVVFYLRRDAVEGERLEEVDLRFSRDMDLSAVRSVKFYYGGTRRPGPEDGRVMAPVSYISSHTPGKTLAANPSYSVLQSEVEQPGREVVLRTDLDLVPGPNFFWISIRMGEKAGLDTRIGLEVTGVKMNGKSQPLRFLTPKGGVHRTGVGVRHAGDDGSAAYRIPGLVTTGRGTLLGVYDVRYNSSVDLQEHIDVGLSRSTDGGRTWEKMRIPLAFGETGGLPAAQNGVGDPAILVDRVTGTVWVVAAWLHGIGNQRAWFNSAQGMEPGRTAQLVMSRSDDDGRTWSAPVNITGQVKDPSWHFLLQGPGRGVCMEDGTLVFPIQFIAADRIPSAGIMYSLDRGRTWKIHQAARRNTTEAQVAEIGPGVLMLNMRDNRGGSRAVSVTRDLGRTWTEHPSSRKALPEPVCMASLIAVRGEDNVLGRDILLFSNPNTTKGRHHMTVKASLDGGLTWPSAYQVMLDEGEGWGYSCLSMIDRETVGILYESSTAHITFQAVPLRDIVK